MECTYKLKKKQIQKKSPLYILMCTKRCQLKFVPTTNVSVSISNFLSSELVAPLACLFATLLIYFCNRSNSCRDRVIEYYVRILLRYLY